MRINEQSRPSPLFSIVVATYNAEAHIASLLDSICDQREKSLEVILSDGLSGDSTVARAEEYSSRINMRIISERDSGIYDAWNKALKLAAGEWIIFMGADDRFYSEDSLQTLGLHAQANPEANLICSNGVVLHPISGLPMKNIGGPLNNRIFRYMTLCHPGLAHSRTLFQNASFNCSYKIAADYDFILSNFSTIRASYLDDVLVTVGGGGVSRSMISKVLSETLAIQIKTSGRATAAPYLNFLLAWVKSLYRRIVEKVA